MSRCADCACGVIGTLDLRSCFSAFKFHIIGEDLNWGALADTVVSLRCEMSEDEGKPASASSSCAGRWSLGLVTRLLRSEGLNVCDLKHGEPKRPLQR